MIILNDNHPFLYNLLLKIYAHVFGTSDFVLRFFSTIWIVFGAIVSFTLLHKHGYKILALSYTPLFVLAPNTIYYAQECRNYAMILSLASIFCVLLYLVLESLHKKLSLKHPNRYFAGIFVCGSAMVLTHYYAYVFVFAAGVILLIESLRTKTHTLGLFVAFLCIGSIGIAWITFHHIVGGFLYRMDGAWVYEQSIWSLLFSIILSAFGKFGWVLVTISLLVCFIKYKPIDLCKEYKPLLYIVGLELFIVVGVFFGISQTMTPRYFMELYPLIYLFVATILSAFWVFFSKMFVLIVLALIGHSAFLSATYHKTNLALASQYIVKEFDSKECILPVEWEAYTRYLPTFRYVQKPLWQEQCDLILLGGNTHSQTTALLAEHNIIAGYEILEFEGAVVVRKSVREKIFD